VLWDRQESTVSPANLEQERVDEPCALIRLPVRLRLGLSGTASGVEELARDPVAEWEAVRAPHVAPGAEFELPIHPEAHSHGSHGIGG